MTMNGREATPTLLKLARRIHHGELTVEEAVRILLSSQLASTPEM